MAGLKYDEIIKYVVHAKCEGPLHIGSSVGGKEDVLIHPVDHAPFIQASSIAGVFRSYAESYTDMDSDELFGTAHLDQKRSTTEQQSRIRFTDGKFDLSSVKMELRPHVKIDRNTGSVSSSKSSGQKFDMEYVGAGAEFITSIYLYLDSEENSSMEKQVKMLFGAMKSGEMRFGAKKSSGAGSIVPISIKTKTFHLDQASDRENWLNEELLEDSAYEEIVDLLPKTNAHKERYKVVVKGKTEGAILIKGLSVSEFGPGAPDSENIRNSNGDYIVPGSSFRGAMRSQMEKISSYLGKESLIEDSFGKAGEDQEESYAGNLVFSDAVIGDRMTNDMVELRHRIHIDKFTGGVFQQGLFAEKNAVGDIELEIAVIDKNQPDAVFGLLMLALRDLAGKVMTLGSGFSTGKGYIDVSEITIQKGEDTAQVMFQEDVVVKDDSNIIQDAITALKEAS